MLSAVCRLQDKKKEKVEFVKFVKFSFNWSFQSHKYILRKKVETAGWKGIHIEKQARGSNKKKVGKNSKAVWTSENIAFFFGNRPASYLSFISCKLALILGPSNCLKHQDWKWPSHQFYFYVPRTYHALVKIDNFKPTNPIVSM